MNEEAPSDSGEKIRRDTEATKHEASVMKFGPFTVTPQVFHLSQSRLTFALVNLKPLLPGHVLVCPKRGVERFSQLTVPETNDLFLTVRRVSRMIERVYKASSLNIAVQDGIDAGQSVAHLHVHIIPRQSNDLTDRGGGDAIYDMMDSEEGDLGQQFRERDRRKRDWNGPDAEDRKPRSEEVMKTEANMLKTEMELEAND